MIEVRAPNPRDFVSYGRVPGHHGGAEFVDRLVAELTCRGFDVWRDDADRRTDAGSQATKIGATDDCEVVAVLTPHAVWRRTAEAASTASALRTDLRPV